MRVATVTLALVIALLASAPAFACTLFRTDDSEQADLRVYFTRFESEDDTGGRYRDCEIVDIPVTGTLTFWITPFRQDANAIVHPDNWPEDR